MKSPTMARQHLHTLRQAALVEVEYRARRILRQRPHFGEFIMAMGTAFFTDKAGNVLRHEQEHYHQHGNHPYTYTLLPWACPVMAYLEEHDAAFGLTGEPMRFTANGPVIRVW